MAIDTSTPQSPGWWLARLSRRLDEKRRRIDRLDSYRQGDPPLPFPNEEARRAFTAFVRRSRSNFAELVAEAVAERMTIRGFRTALQSEDTGDDAAWGIWTENDLEVASADVHSMVCGLGEAYGIAGEADGQAVMTCEDPRQVVTENDPVRPHVARAALKMFYDDVNQLDLAYLYLPGKIYRAGRSRQITVTQQGFAMIDPGPISHSWAWLGPDLEAFPETADLDLVPQDLPAAAANIVPVVHFKNKWEMAEFEPHIDVLDRINHTILERLTILRYQAAKQRAVIGDLPETDDKGNEIDYDKVFEADPGAVWTLPAGGQMWESSALDLTGVLSATKADVEHLGALTRTPMYYMIPGESQQSAEGAAVAKEGLIFKTENRIARLNPAWRRYMSYAFLLTGDTQRADLSKLQPMWQPAARYSLSEMASASAQSVSVLPWETLLEQVWQLSPEEISRAKSQRQSDLVLAQQQAMITAAAYGQTDQGSSGGAQNQNGNGNGNGNRPPTPPPAIPPPRPPMPGNVEPGTPVSRTGTGRNG